MPAADERTQWLALEREQASRMPLNYLSVNEARAASGLRLVLTVGMPGAWSESAKQIFNYKRLPFAPVAQYLNEANEELLGWAGVRNAPVAVFDSETPCTAWLDILMLGERLAPALTLLPASSSEREDALALCNEVIGEWGFGWCRRLMLLQLARSMQPIDATHAHIQRGYGFDDSAALDAASRAAAVLHCLSRRLRDQHRLGSRYFVGNAFGACDLYWACFSQMVRPLAHALAPMPAMVREFFSTSHPLIEAALDPILLEHRDFVFHRHLQLPLEF